MLVETHEHWIEALSALIEPPDPRRRIVEAARPVVSGAPAT